MGYTMFLYNENYTMVLNIQLAFILTICPWHFITVFYINLNNLSLT